MDKDNEIEGVSLWLLLIAITVAGGWLRVLFLAKHGLWLDEAFSSWLAGHNVVDMLQWVSKIDQHPPLYYLLLHYWTDLRGNTPYELRLLSALFGVATIPVIFLIGKRISGAALGLTAALLLALSPFNIRFAQETRMYTLLTFNAAAAIYALVRLLTDPRSAGPIGSQFRDYIRAWRSRDLVEPGPEGNAHLKGKMRGQTGWRAWIFNRRRLPIQAVETDLAWTALIVFSAATLYSHNTAILFLAATNLFVLGLLLVQRIKKPGGAPFFQAPSCGNWLKAQLGIFILWSPWLFSFWSQASRVDQEFWLPAPRWDTVIQTLKSLLNESIVDSTGPIAVVWILYAALLVMGLVYFRKRVSGIFLLAALFAVPFFGELLVSIRRPIFLDRTLIWITLPLLLVVAAGIVQLKHRTLIILALGIVSTINLFSASDYYRYMRKEEWGNAAGLVALNVEKDDLILFNATWSQIPFDYYFKTYEDEWYMPIEKHGVPADLFDRGILEPKMTESDIPRLMELVNGRKRVWLVYSHNDYTDPNGIVEKTLSTALKLAQKREFYGGQVLFYEAR